MVDTIHRSINHEVEEERGETEEARYRRVFSAAVHHRFIATSFGDLGVMRVR
jgi:hypothetical protein